MIFVLNKQESLVGVLNNDAPKACPYYDDIHIENIQTGVNTYQFKIPANHETAASVDEDGYVIFRDLDNRMQMFQIKEIIETGDDTAYEKDIYCEHIAVPELLSWPVRPQKLYGRSLKQLADNILAGSGWKLGEYDWIGFNDLIIEDYSNALEQLYKIMEIFSAEVEFEVKFVNGKVTERLVHLTSQRGTVTHKRFEYGKDLVEVKRTVNTEGVITALIVVGKGDSDKARLTLASFTPDNIPDGFTKEYSEDFIASEDAFQIYNKNGRHIFGIYTYEDGITKQNLFDAGLKELKTRMKPTTTYEMKVVLLERMINMDSDAERTRIGDTINVDDIEFNPRLALEARIIEMQRSYTAPENDACTLGDYRPIKISNYKDINALRAKITASEEAWNTNSFVVSVESTGGDTFKNGQGNSMLTAKVFKGEAEQDSMGTDFIYTWTKYDKDGNVVTGWTKTGKNIAITNADVDEKATFSVDIETI